MQDQVPDVRLLRYALASATHGSFRLAAAALNVQHSAVIRGVRDLEHRIGAALFERGHAGVRPTKAGDQFLEEARLGFDHLQRAMQRLRAAERGENGELIIGVTAPFALIGDAIEQFRTASVGVALEIVETTTSEGSTAVHQRRMDVAFVAKPPAGSQLRALHVRDVGLFVTLQKSHPLATARAVALDELRSEQLIVRAAGSGPDISEYLYERARVSKLGGGIRIHRVGQCDLIKMVAKGFGAAVVLGPVAGAVFEEVAVVPLAEGNRLPLYLIWSTSNQNPALKPLLSVIRRSIPPRLA